MALRLTAALLSLLSSVALARFLGAQGFGAYSYALTLVGLVAVPVTLGVPQLLVREVAAYGARGQWGEMGGLLRRANQVALGGSLLLALAAFAVSSHFLGGVDAGGYAAFAVGLVMLPLMALAAMRMAALQGLGYVVLRQLPEGVCKPLLLLVFVFSASVLMGHGQLTPVRAMAMHLVAAGLAFLLGAWFLHTRMPPHVRNVDPQYEHRIWLREAMPLLLLGGVQFANQQVGLLMVGSLKGPEAAGLYQVRHARCRVHSAGVDGRQCGPGAARLPAVCTRRHRPTAAISDSDLKGGFLLLGAHRARPHHRRVVAAARGLRC